MEERKEDCETTHEIPSRPILPLDQSCSAAHSMHSAKSLLVWSDMVSRNPALDPIPRCEDGISYARSSQAGNTTYLVNSDDDVALRDPVLGVRNLPSGELRLLLARDLLEGERVEVGVCEEAVSPRFSVE